MHDRYNYRKTRVKRDKIKRGYKYKKYSSGENTKLKVVSMIAVPVFLLGGTGVYAKKKDEKIDHVNTVCHFTQICEELGLDIGWQHQLNEIQKTGVKAYFQKGRVDTYYRKSTIISDRDIPNNYYEEEIKVPNDYQLLEEPVHGYDCYKQVEVPEAIIIDEGNGQTKKLILKK